ncbi:MAG: hypothetical protein ACRELB_17910 [Polyangiaceae bacterium]
MKAWSGWMLLCGLVIASYRAIDPADPRWAAFDLHRYEAMRLAVPGFASVRAPEAFRLAAPWLAALVGWGAVAYGSLFCCVALLWRWLRVEGLTTTGAGVGVVLFSSSHFFAGEIAWDHYQACDALGFAALLAAMCAVQAGRWRSFAAVLAVGCLVRETPILAVPYAFAAAPRQWRRVLPASMVGLAVLCALHTLVPHDGGLTLPEAVRAFAPTKLSAVVLARDAGAFAPTGLVPLVAPGPTRAVLRLEHAVLLAAVLVAALAGADIERLMMPCAPVVLLMVAAVAERWPAPHRIALVVLGIVGSAHHNMTRWPLPSRTWTAAITLLTTALAVGVAIVAQRDTRTTRR